MNASLRVTWEVTSGKALSPRMYRTSIAWTVQVLERHHAVEEEAQEVEAVTDVAGRRQFSADAGRPG